MPDSVRACLFDMDGVLTQTAKVHAAAWQEMFDDFLRAWSERHGEPFRPFDPHADYLTYIDGKARADGTRAFLESRGIRLPEGGPGDTAADMTISGLSTRKNDLVRHILDRDGVQVYDGSVGFVRRVREAGLRTAVVSASANTEQVLRAAGIGDLFDTRVDGVVAKERGLRGKPAPDGFLAAARDLAVPPGEAAVFEDALAGVQAGRAGGFGLVVGVDRAAQADALRAHGADIVVTDLADLLERP
jgi:beta-phosphoglucomutase family hydrolase